MLLKKIVVLSSVALISFLSIGSTGCKSDGEKICDKFNDLCKTNLNCDEAADKYDEEEDKATDAEKEAADKYVDCIDDAETCDAVKACSGASGVDVGGSSSGASSSGNASSSSGG